MVSSVGPSLSRDEAYRIASFWFAGGGAAAAALFSGTTPQPAWVARMAREAGENRDRGFEETFALWWSEQQRGRG